MTILVTGGRGRIARAVVAGLTAAGLDPRVASRDTSAVPGSVPFDLTDPSTVSAALRDVTQVFLYAEPTTAAAFVEAADAAGVKKVVLLSSMSSYADNEDAAADPHAETERVIKTGAYAVTCLQPGAFMTNAIFWSYALRATGQIRLPYLDAEEAPIHEQDIADAAVQVLLAGPGSPHDGRAYPLSGPESMTRRRQIEQITEVTGVPIEAVDLAPAQAEEEMSRGMRNQAQFRSLMSYWASRVGLPHPIEPGVELLTAHPARSWQTWLRDHPEVFAE
ncbi:uncharacterized protein YbjT (DUF2867 family) [Kribbella amoyensis]|uniref:Uncharacterized protein YbjT (DUF2867 family) n=1 Tax=Kribbella amoyensis TaxID=996641 RepID=A0A561BTW5_9ACTN|nr:NAD(P)H-binding protein [Kribbella amoyensis]TWD82261.1 uncharacterized protein YbjT (DUF2867 family) [Kribbella amoyensis]